MDKYRLTAPVTFQPPARLQLSKDQVEPRAASLLKVGKAWEVLAPVTFKAGEELGHDGELPKALAQHMSPRASRKDAAADDDAPPDIDIDTETDADSETP